MVQLHTRHRRTSKQQRKQRRQQQQEQRQEHQWGHRQHWPGTKHNPHVCQGEIQALRMLVLTALAIVLTTACWPNCAW